MKDRRMFGFELVRGAAAIQLALGVGTIFILLSSDEPLTALRYLLIGPLVSLKDGIASFNTQGLNTILAAMIPTIFTGLAVCVMFSSNQFNLAGEGVVMAGGFVAALCGIYIHMASGWHAAFWLQSPSIGAHPNPKYCGVECDIMENYRQHTEGTIGCGNGWGSGCGCGNGCGCDNNCGCNNNCGCC